MGFLFPVVGSQRTGRDSIVVMSSLILIARGGLVCFRVKENSSRIFWSATAANKLLAECPSTRWVGRRSRPCRTMVSRISSDNRLLTLLPTHSRPQTTCLITPLSALPYYRHHWLTSAWSDARVQDIPPTPRTFHPG